MICLNLQTFLSPIYNAYKLKKAEEKITELQQTVPRLEDIPGLLQINNINPSSKTKNQRLTDVHGSLKAKDALKLASEKRAEEQKKEEKREMSRQNKIDMKQRFQKCRERCVCEGETCDADGLKECSICKSILRSQCMKKKCILESKSIGLKRPKMQSLSRKTVDFKCSYDLSQVPSTSKTGCTKRKLWYSDNSSDLSD